MDTSSASPSLALDTSEQDASHTTWLRREISKSLADPRPSVMHDEAMARIRQTIATLKGTNQRTD